MTDVLSRSACLVGRVLPSATRLSRIRLPGISNSAFTSASSQEMDLGHHVPMPYAAAAIILRSIFE